MELFAGIANVMGEGLPLSYLFITTERNAAPHTKQAALIAWMSAISSLEIDPQFVLSDKDQSEIVTKPTLHFFVTIYFLILLYQKQSDMSQPGGSYHRTSKGPARRYPTRQSPL
jgi:hypothetical protein